MSPILSKQTYVGLAVDFLDDGTRLISYVSLVKKSNALIRVDSREGLIDLTSLSNFFEDNPNVYLILNGKGIIHKKVDADSIKEVLTQANLIPYVLPNVDAKEFYGQYHEQESTVFISVCRFNLIENLLKELSEANCYPSELILGPFALETIVGFINPNVEINVNSQKLIFLNGKIENIERLENYQKEHYNIEGESLSSDLIIAYSAAILNGLNQDQSTSKIQEIEGNRNTIHFKLKFKKYLAVSLGVFCILLLINFIAFSYLFQQIVTRSTLVSSNEEYLQKQNKTRNDYLKNKEFILNKNWDNKIHITNYIEDLSMAAPSGLKLTNVSYQKIDQKKSRIEKRIIFDYSNIELIGTVRNSEELNEWMKELDKLSYVKDIKLVEYKKSIIGNTFTFNLKILLND